MRNGVLGVLGWMVFWLAGCASVGTHAMVRPARVTQRPWRDWAEVFANPVGVRVTAFVTGEVLVGPSILIEEDNPRTPRALAVERWVPAVSFLVEHPTQGAVLLDTGVSPDHGRGCDYGVSPLFHIRCRAAGGQDVASQLAARGVTGRDLRYVVVSHLHGDHAGGLHELLPRGGTVPVLMSRAEWESADSPIRAVRGYVASIIDGDYPIGLLDLDRAPPMPILGPVLDLFGDGSLWLLPMPGHTRGQLAVLINAPGAPLMLTFDAAHLEANVALQVPPGFVVDHDGAVASLARIGRFHAAFPQVEMIYGHEPAQWAGRDHRVELRPR